MMPASLYRVVATAAIVVVLQQTSCSHPAAIVVVLQQTSCNHHGTIPIVKSETCAQCKQYYCKPLLVLCSSHPASGVLRATKEHERPDGS